MIESTGLPSGPRAIERCARLVSESAEETVRLGWRLGGELRPGDVVLLVGPFGAGKTTFTQGIARGIGIEAYVTSPSFTLVNEYRAPFPGGHPPLFHVDLYRVSRAEEALDFGLGEYLRGDGICVVEWAERALEALPDEHILVVFDIDGDRRLLSLCPRGARYARRSRALFSALRRRPSTEGQRVDPSTEGQRGDADAAGD